MVELEKTESSSRWQKLLGGWRSALFALAIFSISTVFTHRTISNPAANISEWHVSYSQGYTRRGLRGEVLELWQMLTQLDWAWAESTIRSIPIGILLYLVLRKLGSLKRPGVSVAAFLFPLGPTYFIYDPGSSGTTDALFLLLTYSIFWTLRRRATWRHLLLLFIFAATVSFYHEGYIFFLPLVLGLGVLLRKGNISVKTIAQTAVVVCLPFAVSALLALFAAKPHMDYFCGLAEARLPNASCDSLRTFREASLLEGVQYSLDRQASLETLVLFGWICLAFWAALILYRGMDLMKVGNKLIATLLPHALLFSTVPIFLVGGDWGRWISIIYGSFFLATLFAAPGATPRYAYRVLLGSMVLPVISGTGTSLAGIVFWFGWVFQTFGQ